MTHGHRPSRPYVMRGVPEPSEIDRPTSQDPRDHRINPPPTRALTLEETRVITRLGAGTIDPRLRPADRWLERWAATGSELAAMTGPLSYGKSTLAPYASQVTTVALSDAESLLVDSAVRDAPGWAKRFAILWYRSGLNVQEIAEELKIRRRRAVYEEREIVLAYYLGRFTEIGLRVTFWVDSD